MDNFASDSGARTRAMSSTARILIIAGSDSGGGAGIQADIKTVTMLGGHAMTAITAVTAQNSLGVDAVHPVPAEIVLAQIDSVVRDLGVDAIKIGMIGSAFTARMVAERLAAMEPRAPLVFDPVMIATSGAALADEATLTRAGLAAELIATHPIALRGYDREQVDAYLRKLSAAVAVLPGGLNRP